jgi:endonuclease/exonuclease/phosphatase family metal-dependent hydrolase
MSLRALDAARALAWAGWLSLGLGLAWWPGMSHAAPRGSTLTLMTWNMEWLITPEADRAMRPSCTFGQPPSNQHALPCTPGRAAPPQRQSADYDAMARTAQRLLTEYQADVVALEEVDGAPAADLVFRKGWMTDCFIKRAHPQKVGFAIRDGIPYLCNDELIALDRDASSRAGADITLWPGTPQAVRLLAVHMKSGCFDGKLDRHFGACQALRGQIPVVEQWIDARVREGMAFAVLGDFNRHLNKDAQYPAGDDESAPVNVFNAWSDNQPPGAVLTRATEGASYVPCDTNDKFHDYIDDVLLSKRLVNQSRRREFKRAPYALREQGRLLSDHCPLGIKLEGLSP